MTTLPDIPRLYTALAEWLACLLYVLALRRRFGTAVTAVISGAGLVLLGTFLQLTGGVPLAWWIPCMATAVAAMYLFLFGCCAVTPREAGYCCARAFILAEFAASLEWQLHCLLWPQRSGWELPALGLLVLVYAGGCSALSTGLNSAVCSATPNWGLPGGRWPAPSSWRWRPLQ